MNALRELEKEFDGSDHPDGPIVEVRDLDYNLLTFEEQIKNDIDTDIMVFQI